VLLPDAFRATLRMLPLSLSLSLSFLLSLSLSLTRARARSLSLGPHPRPLPASLSLTHYVTFDKRALGAHSSFLRRSNRETVVKTVVGRQ
jgi:hypothetical protein